MKVLNIGSLNIDYVYTVDHIILPGETEATGSRSIFSGPSKDSKPSVKAIGDVV